MRGFDAHPAAPWDWVWITSKPQVEPMVRGSSLQKLENQNLDEVNWSPSALNLRKVVVCATDPLVLEDANKMGVN
jgi:hypothetical protein